MISVREVQLFNSPGTMQNIMAMPVGAYITDAFIQHGSVYVSVLWDDSRPHVNRKFHCTGPFTPISTQPGKRCWHVGTVGVNMTDGSTYRYYY